MFVLNALPPQVDRQLLDNALAIHRNSGVAILARPDLPEDSQRVNQPGTHRLFGVLGRMFDNVVIVRKTVR